MDTPESTRKALSVLLIGEKADQAGPVPRHLERCGYMVTQCSTGRAALDLLQRLVPDVVVTPHRLEGADALELCRAAVSLPRPAIVIFVNDTWDLPEVSLLSAVGASDFMRSPLDRDELVVRIELHARLRGTRRMPALAPRPPAKTGEAPLRSMALEAATPAEGLILRRPRPPRRGESRARVLVYDSDALMGRALCRVLQLRGFATTTMTKPLSSGVAALWRARDALVVHIGKTEAEALAICSVLRERISPLLVVATARTVTHLLRERALSAGADEVVPFVSVVDALESRYPARGAASANPAQDLSAQVKLTRSERRLLRVLQAAGADGVYQEDLQARGELASEEAVRAHMKRMRRKLAVVGLDITPMEGRYRLVRLPGAS
ncbi:MAG: hypothetical protein AMXMBFR56_76670 [Polyangiaceae bacterium]